MLERMVKKRGSGEEKKKEGETEEGKEYNGRKREKGKKEVQVKDGNEIRNQKPQIVTAL